MTPAPQRRNPAGGPGFEAKQVVAGASQSYLNNPGCGTVIGQVLAALREGRSLTSRECWIEFGGSRLAAVVHRLRRDGWPIQTEEIPVSCRGGRVAHVARYSIPDGGGR